MADLRLVRLQSSTVLVQVHVTQDSRFMLVPVIPEREPVGWRIYNIATGSFAEPTTSELPIEGYESGVWERLYQARDWLSKSY